MGGGDVSIDFMTNSILHIHQFSWVFLVDWLMIIALSIFCLFYFNQLLGLLVTHTAGWYLWHRYGVYLNVQSIEISLLGGRIMFRNITYIGTSQACRIVYGSLSWRYWLSERRRSSFLLPKLEKEDVDDENFSGSAFKLKMYGVEWFVYNREYAYEALMKKEAPINVLTQAWEEWQLGLSYLEHKFTELLPLQVHIHQLGVVIGNDDTESLLVVSSPHVDWLLDMAPASTEVDRYMVRTDMNLQLVGVDLRANQDYKVSSIKPETVTARKKRQRKFWKHKLRMKYDFEPWFGLRRFSSYQHPNPQSTSTSPHQPTSQLQSGANDSPTESPTFSSKIDSDLQHTTKDRTDTTVGNNSQDTAQSEHTEEERIDDGKIDNEVRSRLAALPVEYAKVSQLLSCDVLKINQRMDVPGRGESTKPPLHEVKIDMFNAKMNYGPYAERQRQSFFSSFFPRSCSTPAELKPGERLHTRATVSISLSGESTLVVPIRELSKDEEFVTDFARHWHTYGAELQRNFGWMEIRAAEQSHIEISVPLMPGHDGFHTVCNVDLVKPVVRSSVNHDTMFCASHHSVFTDLHQPLVWNALNTYRIQQQSTSLDFFALREHVTLIDDMIADFAAGPPVPYELFTPAVYIMTWDVQRMAWYLNVNKGNIINAPTSMSENTFLVLSVPEINIVWDIPRNEIAAPTTKVLTLLAAPRMDIDLSAPNWHTLQEFLDCKRLATVEKFSIKLEHHITMLTPAERDAEACTSPLRFVNTQMLEVAGSQLVLLTHGFVVDYVMRIRENYFGHAYHFQTTEEFLEHQDPNNRSPVTEPHEFTRGEVDSDTQMRIRVDRGSFLLPQRLYSTTNCLVFQFMSMDVECRFTNYYMDLQVEIAPMMGRVLRGLNPCTVHEEARRASFMNADLSVSHLGVHAHRMFGLPPAEPTYVVRWDFDLGDITTDFRSDFLQTTGDALEAFVHSFDDDENKPVMAPEELNDVTFVGVTVASLLATVRPPNAKGEARIELATSSISIKKHDLATDRYSGKTIVDIPYIRVRGYMPNGNLTLEATAGVNITGFVNKPEFREQREKQQSHIALHDAMFHRAPFLLDESRKRTPPFTDHPQPVDFRVCMPLPVFPPPLTRDTIAPHLMATDDFFMREHDSSSHHTSLQSLMSKSHTSSGNEDSEYEGITEDESEEDSVPPRRAWFARVRQEGRIKQEDSLYGTPQGTPQITPSVSTVGLDQMERHIDEVFPFSSSTTTADREWLRSRCTRFGLHPRAWRPNAPALAVDEKIENKSFVVQIAPVNISLTPDTVALAAAFDSDPVVDFEAQLDDLQVRVFRGLIRKGLIREILRAHIVMPSLTIILSEHLGSAHSVRLEVEDVEFLLESDKQSLRGVHADFQSLAVSLRQGNAAELAQISAASLVVSKFEFWWQQFHNKQDKQDATGSLDISGVDLSVAAEQIEWAVHYILQLVRVLPARHTQTHSRPKLSKHEQLMATFYALTMAGEQMGIEQDSYVLSRPSGTVQSEDHVRSKISWRIVMRLRYLMQRIPPAKRVALQREIAERKFDLPKNAKQQLLEVYRNWRSWEQSRDLADTEIFKLVFDDKSFQEYVLSLSTRAVVGIESMVTRIVYRGGNDHYLGISALYMHLVSTQTNDTQILSLNLRCSKISALGSIELVVVAATIIAAIQTEIASQSKVSHTTLAADTDESDMASNQNSMQSSSIKRGRALQANVSVFLLDLIMEFNFDTINVETQNHQVQFTSAVELMNTTGMQSLFHTGTLVSANSAFRVLLTEERQDVIDALVTGSHIGYASSGSGSQNNSWATVDVDSASLVSHPTIEQVMAMVYDFLEKEMPFIQRAADKLERSVPQRPSVSRIPQVQNSDTSSDDEYEENFTGPTNARQSSSLDQLSSGWYVNFNFASLKLRAKLFEDFKLVWVGSELLCKLRHSRTMVACFEVLRSTAGIHFSDSTSDVANIQVDNLKSVLQYQLGMTTVYNNLGELRVETMSLVWILEYARRHHLDDQFVRILEATDDVIELLDDQDSPTPTFKRKDFAKRKENKKNRLKLRLMNQVNLITLKLTLDKIPLHARVTSAKLNYIKVDAAGPEIIGGIDDFLLELVMPRQKPRELAHIKFALHTRQEDGRILANVESDYIQFALDPEAVGALYLTIERLKRYGDMFAMAENSSNSPMHKNSPQTPKESRFKLADLEKLRLRILLNYLTLTWYTDMHSTEGIVLGYDKLQVSFAKLAAHIELAGAYITPVSSSTVPMKDRQNTAYLPLLETYMFVAHDKKKPLVEVNISGKSVALTLTPSIGPWALTLTDSVVNTRNTLENLAIAKSREITKSPPNASKSEEDPMNEELVTNTSRSALEIPFDVRLTTSFDRSVIRLFDDGTRSKDPALELFSPRVDIGIEFANRRLLLRVDASQTANKIYPKAVAEIKALSVSIASEMKTRAARQNNETPPQSPSAYGFNSPNTPESSWFRDSRTSTAPAPNKGAPAQACSSLSPSALGDLELDVHVHFEPQELHLSSLPYGKVGALLSTEGLDLVFTTPKASYHDQSYFAFQGLVKRTRLSLQHMYSREISAMIEISRLTTVGLYRNDEPFKLVVDIHGLKVNLNLSKLHDMRIFFDVWTLYANNSAKHNSPEPESKITKIRRKYSTASTQPRPILPLNTALSVNTGRSSVIDDEASETGSVNANDELLINKYKNALSLLPFLYTINLSIHNAEAVVGMGGSIGEAKLTMGRLWVALMKSSPFDQMLNAGIDSVAANFEGRLSGVLRLDGILAKIAIKIREERSYPLLHAKLRLDKIGFYFGLDFHPFITGDTNGLAIILTTQDKVEVTHDRVHVAMTCDSVSLVLTALVVVHTYDVLALFKRLQSQISLAPIFMSAGAAQETEEPNSERHEERHAKKEKMIMAMNLGKGMRILIDIRLGMLLVHMFPTEFSDNLALKIFANHVEAHYDRQNLAEELQVGIDLALDECMVGLANIKGGGYKEHLADLDYVQFLAFVRKSSSGGTIVSTPEVAIRMDTWEYKNRPNEVYYTFSNQVRGTIAFGWNLGSVNFIKEMLNVHRDACASREDLYEATSPEMSDAKALREATANIERTGSTASTTPTGPGSPTTPTTCSHRRTSSAELMHSSVITEENPIELFGIKYIAKKKPVILIPQVRDLGDATPPIEWLGVNRERIPLFIHYFLTRKATLAAAEIEKICLEVIGRLD